MEINRLRLLIVKAISGRMLFKYISLHILIYIFYIWSVVNTQDNKKYTFFLPSSYISFSYMVSGAEIGGFVLCLKCVYLRSTTPFC